MRRRSRFALLALMALLADCPAGAPGHDSPDAGAAGTSVDRSNATPPVGSAADGATCNKLAAMYRGTVPTCSPKLHCGKLPIDGAARRGAAPSCRRTAPGSPSTRPT